jgi:glutamyl-tRNA synthetase
MNRDIIDDGANRYFFISDPVKFNVSGVNELNGNAPLHPDHPERGTRDYLLKGDISVHIASSDANNFMEAGLVRLKDLCNLEFGDPAKYAGTDVSVLKKGVRAVQWVSSGIPTELQMPDGTVLNGLSETALLSEKNEMIQFERVGFVRIEKNDKEMIKAVFSHR